MPQSPEFFDVRVINARIVDAFRERLAIELGIVPGARNGSDIDEALHPVPLKQVDEFIDRSCGMANRQDERRRFVSFSIASRFGRCLQSTRPTKQAIDQNEEHD